MSEESIKVAVRVRPFNKREIDRKAKCIIEMADGTITTITNPGEPHDGPKPFTFDHSYWSHDGFKEEMNGYLVPADKWSKYDSQSKVFDDLGKMVLENAFAGFNCTLFAYGQTGSGKSYSMVGYGANKGIVPVTCEAIFDRVEKKTNDNCKFEVTFSMLEIYMEQVNDLLSKQTKQGGLQIRQHPSQGFFYAQDLSKIPVGDYKEIEQEIEKGTAKRTVASTQMNATSSRAHTVVTVTFDQIFKGANGETKKSSVINLVDLAGSERADSTGATGDRLKEGANINKSLSALSNVIKALADLSSNPKKRNIMVPYRDSVLTKLLQNALGGNSKTIMIAALSPADINYQETLSTLRYADRAKQIKTKAVVNENQVEKLIRQLKEENERLRLQLESGNIGTAQMTEINTGATEEEMETIRKEILEELKAQMSINAEAIENNTTTFQERLEKAQQESMAEKKNIKEKKQKKNKEPYLTNLNEDPILSYVICYFLSDAEILIGSSEDCQIQLTGLNICSEHARIVNEDGFNVLIPEAGAKLKVNGQPVANDEVELAHNDRILFGSSHLYVYVNPQSAEYKEMEKVTYDMAQKEIAATKGFYRQNTIMTDAQQIVEEEIVKVLPIIADLNAISEELNKYRFFEVVLIPTAVFSDRPSLQSDSKVMIRVTNLQSMNMWLWDIGKLQNRRYMIMEFYQKYLEGDDSYISKLIKKEADPFWDAVEDLFIAMGRFFLHSLSYRMEFEDKAFISDYSGKEIGTVVFRVTPCDANGDDLGEAYYVEDPETLIAEKFFFKVEILNLQINNYLLGKGFKLKFKVFGEKYRSETPLVEVSHDMTFNYSKIVCFESIQRDHLKFFEHGCITFFVYSVQKERSIKNSLLGMSTRELKIYRDEEKANPKAETVEFIENSNHKFYDMDPAQIKLELSLLQNKFDILNERETSIKDLCSKQIKNTKNSKDLNLFLSAIMKVLNGKPNTDVTQPMKRTKTFYNV